MPSEEELFIGAELLQEPTDLGDSVGLIKRLGHSYLVVPLVKKIYQRVLKDNVFDKHREAGFPFHKKDLVVYSNGKYRF